jgi:hypothetical protein
MWPNSLVFPWQHPSLPHIVPHPRPHCAAHSRRLKIYHWRHLFVSLDDWDPRVCSAHNHWKKPRFTWLVVEGYIGAHRCGRWAGSGEGIARWRASVQRNENQLWLWWRNEISLISGFAGHACQRNEMRSKWSRNGLEMGYSESPYYMLPKLEHYTWNQDVLPLLNKVPRW